MYTPSRRVVAATAALASALLMSGCASDDDTPLVSPSQPVTASASPSTAASVDDMCAAKVAIDAAFLAGGPPDSGEEAPSPEQVGQGISAAFSGPYAELKRTAQPEVADAVNQEVDALNAAISSGDGEFFFKPDFVAADKKIDDFLSNECGFNKIAATAVNYEYQGLPTVSPAGITGLTLTNNGTEFHEIVLMRVNDDVTQSDDELLKLDEKQVMSKVQPMGVVLATPGSTATNFFDLKPGRYIALCTISKGSTAYNNFNGDGPPHFTLGMHESLRVLSDSTASPSSSSSSSSVGSSGSSSSSSSSSTSGSSGSSGSMSGMDMSSPSPSATSSKSSSY